MTEAIAVEIPLSDIGAYEQGEVVAIAVSVLYDAAARKWPGRRTTRSVDKTDQGMRVELTPWPEEMQAMVEAAGGL